MSAARKFGTVVRTHTPSVNGTHTIATSDTVCRGVRRGISSRSLNRVDRASELDTAAATPSSTSSVIRISLGSVCVTSLLYARKSLTTDHMDYTDNRKPFPTTPLTSLHPFLIAFVF